MQKRREREAERAKRTMKEKKYMGRMEKRRSGERKKQEKRRKI